MLRLLFFLVITSTLSSCSLFTKKGSWGRKALWPIKGSKISEAFKKNISSPHVWGPTAGAAVIWAGGWDKNISNWAWDKNVLFDNHQDSDHWSDHLADALLYQMYLTPLFTASSQDGDTFIDYAASKTKGYLVISLSSQTADWTRDALARSFRRERPSHENHLSFPSGHSNQAGTRNVLVSRNLDSIPMNEHLRFGIKTVNTGAASLLLWSRVEAKAHYPTDVLMGYALGAFISGFMYDSLMNMDEENPETFSVTPLKDAWTFQYTYAF